MYLKIINESQLDLLKQVNKCMGNRKLPKEALRIVRVILDKESLGIHDYIALFLKPVKDDTRGICDKMRFYPYTMGDDKDYFGNVKVKGNPKIVWSCYMIQIKETGARIFLVYSMKKKDIQRKSNL